MPASGLPEVMTSSAAGNKYIAYSDILNFLWTDLDVLCLAVLMLRGKDTMSNSKTPAVEGKPCHHVQLTCCTCRNV
jgi:hypothetical protein